MNWLSLALALLKLANLFLSWQQSKKDFDAGVDSEVAKAATETLKLTTAGKKLMERLDAMSEDQLSDLERRLERPSNTG